MNRYRKEELRRRREAREGLTPEEVADLDHREAEAASFEDEVRSWHSRIFTEEYDHMYDSIADARDRDRGVNPMSQEYIARVNARRAALGFADYMDTDSDLPLDTQSWVRDLLRAEKRDELQEVLDGTGTAKSIVGIDT